MRSNSKENTNNKQNANKRMSAMCFMGKKEIKKQWKIA